nr:hypothetical protein Iba_scaffold30932CG0010 [Ipomoea batatas]GMD14837.1 hypothetical protein Iba_scaffold40855CG0010 [Ipomoea batatas]
MGEPEPSLEEVMDKSADEALFIEGRWVSKKKKGNSSYSPERTVSQSTTSPIIHGGRAHKGSVARPVVCTGQVATRTGLWTTLESLPPRSEPRQLRSQVGRSRSPDCRPLCTPARRRSAKPSTEPKPTTRMLSSKIPL